MKGEITSFNTMPSGVHYGFINYKYFFYLEDWAGSTLPKIGYRVEFKIAGAHDKFAENVRRVK